MKFSIAPLVTLALVAFANAGAPHAARSVADPTSIDVLQYALSLEHLENMFYNALIQKYSAEDFRKAGYKPYVRERYLQIVEHEKVHVDVLTSVLTAAGVKPNSACNYKLPFTTLQQYLAASHEFENVGSAAYTGAAAYAADSAAYLAAAASILATEARHSAWIGSSVFSQNPWNTAFESALTFSQVWTIAHPFIASCPGDMSNVPGFSTTFPQLTVAIAAGKAKLTFTPAHGAVTNGQQLYVAFIQGSGTLYAAINSKTNEAVVPHGLEGFVFPLVTSMNGSTADAHVIAGPTVNQFPF